MIEHSIARVNRSGGARRVPSGPDRRISKSPGAAARTACRYRNLRGRCQTLPLICQPSICATCDGVAARAPHCPDPDQAFLRQQARTAGAGRRRPWQSVEYCAIRAPLPVRRLSVLRRIGLSGFFEGFLRDLTGFVLLRVQSTSPSAPLHGLGYAPKAWRRSVSAASSRRPWRQADQPRLSRMAGLPGSSW